MYRSNVLKGLVILSTLAFLLVFAAPALAGDVTITGEVNDNFQLVADGQTYEIADNEKGNDLAENYVSAKVQVVGTLEENEDMKVLTVISFKVVSE